MQFRFNEAVRMRRAVFLDRDGVLNESIVRNGKPYPPANLAQFKLLPDASAALARLKEAGFLLLVVTNQPDVARGAQSRDIVEAMHARMAETLPIDDFFVCWHDDADRCDCRKPLPGLLYSAADRYEVDVRRSFLIGDRWRDIDAGAAAGCRTVLIDHEYNERHPEYRPDYRTSSITGAADWILWILGNHGDASTKPDLHALFLNS
jgi:D-glycero-D-manno-heptose 1,7-bisphosphate phosphatase